MKILLICCDFLRLQQGEAQEIATSQDIALKTSMEKTGDYIQYAPAAASLAVVPAKGEGEGFRHWEVSRLITGH